MTPSMIPVGEAQVPVLFNTRALYELEGFTGTSFWTLHVRMGKVGATVQDIIALLAAGAEGARVAAGLRGSTPWTLERAMGLFDAMEGGVSQWIMDGHLKPLMAALAASLPRQKVDGTPVAAVEEPSAGDAPARPTIETPGGTPSSTGASTPDSPNGTSGS